MKGRRTGSGKIGKNGVLERSAGHSSRCLNQGEENHCPIGGSVDPRLKVGTGGVGRR